MSELVKFLSKADPNLWENRGDYHNYSKCLDLFWRLEFKESLDKTTELILSKNVQDIFPFYRLWIEILAVKKERLALTEMREHLFIRACDDPDCWAWAGLKGVVHLELDELDAAQLIGSGIANQEVNDAYCLELLQRLSWRKATGDDFSRLPLLRSSEAYLDFFSWQTLLRGLLLAEKFDDLIKVLSSLSKIYPKCPEIHLFPYYKHLDYEEYSQAAEFGRALVAQYPSHGEYNFLAGYAFLFSKDYSKALVYLQKSIEVTQELDPDYLSVCAYCHFLLAENDRNSIHWQESLSLYKKAKFRLQSLGLPFDEINLTIAHLSKESSKGFKSSFNEVFKNWAVYLSPIQVVELQDRDEKQIEQIFRPLGQNAFIGEFVFFLSAAPKDSSKFQIQGIYQVNENPLYHPIHGSVTPCELIARPIKPISFQFSVEELGNYPEEVEGVYRIDEKFVDSIIEAIETHNLEFAGTELTLEIGKVSNG